MNAERFALYVAELQQFSATHEVRFGSPEDLPLLLVSLNGCDIFRDECTSMLRSVVYREHGEVPPSELLTLLIAAWGGIPAHPSATSLQEPIAQLRKFASAVMRTSLGPPELPPDQEPSLPPQQPPPTTTEDIPSELEKIHSAIERLVRHSPDVKLYVQLLQECAAQTALQPTPERSLQIEAAPAPSLPPALSLQRPAPAASPPRDDPWAENSELQIQLRRFAARRDARRAYEAEMATRPIHTKVVTAAEAALTRLLGRRRHA